MTLEVRLRSEAEEDLADAAAWYEAQRPGLGQEFLDCVFSAFELIAVRPNMYPASTEGLSEHCFIGFLSVFIIESRQM